MYIIIGTVLTCANINVTVFVILSILCFMYTVFQWFWRLEDHGIPEEYPVEIHRFFFGLPEDVEGFDAVYERPDDGRLVAFNGECH